MNIRSGFATAFLTFAVSAALAPAQAQRSKAGADRDWEGMCELRGPLGGPAVASVLSLACAVALLVVGANPARAQEYVGSLYFPGGQDVLSAEQDTEARRIATRLASQPTRAVLVTGHVSVQNDNNRSLALSGDRSRSVFRALSEAGVSEDRITVQSAGEDKAARSTPRARSDQLDNRVDVFLSSRLHLAGVLPPDFSGQFEVLAGGADMLPLSSICPEIVGNRFLHIDAAEPDLVFRLEQAGSTGFHLASPIETTMVLRGPGELTTCVIGRQGTSTSLPSLPMGEYQLFIGRPETSGAGREVGPFSLRVSRSPA